MRATCSYQTTINAPRDRVWDCLTNAQLFSEWAQELGEGSHVTGEFAAGKQVRFLDKDDNGLLSEVVVCSPGHKLQIKHVGLVIKGQLEPGHADMADWVGCQDTFTLAAGTNDDSTTLHIEMDMTVEYVDATSSRWPRALDRIKDLAEGQGDEVAGDSVN